MPQPSEGADKGMAGTGSGQAKGSGDVPARRLRSAALETSSAIPAAQRRAEEELLRTKESLERSEARLMAIVENAAEGIITIDERGRIESFNSAAARLFGRASAEVLGQSVSILMPAPHRDQHDHYLAEYFQTGVSKVIGVNREVVGLRQDGTTFPMDLAVSEFRLGDRRLFTGIVRDVTERKHNEDALNERVRLLALGSEIGMALAGAGSLQTMLQKCTEAIVRHLDGASARIWTVADSVDELELQASAGMYPDQDGPHGRVPIGKLKIGWIAQERKPHLSNQVVGDPEVGDQDWARREGMVAFAGRPLIVEGGLMGVVAMFARHPLSDATLTALSSAADAIAVGISRKRTEEALVCSELQAQAASRAKSGFLANMSHEIRTPMNGVLNMTRLALKTDLTPKQREYLEMAHRSAESLLEIINDILDFSKIEAGKLTLNAVPFCVHESVENVVRDMAMRAHAKDLELTCDVDPDVPGWLVGDPGRLRQVLLNLVSNAIKFTDRGEVGLTVRRGSATDEEVWLNFAVRDTGIGIPPDQLARTFEAFAQADTSITRTRGGTGLGLTISASLVSMMGGSLEIDSEPGVGSTFHFRARFRTSDQPRQHTSGSPPPPRTGKLRLLLAEDNVINQKVAVGMLEAAGHEITVVNNGQEAVAALEQQPVDAILMDVQMPEMDGLQATAMIREREKTTGRHTPIIALTAHAMKGDQERCLAAGMDDYVSKPIRPEELLRTIGNCVGMPAPHKGRASPDGSADKNTLDQAALLERVGGDVDLLVEILSLCAGEFTRMMEELEIAVSLQDAHRIQAAAHTLKGTLGNLIAADAYEAARRLEDMGRKGELDRVEETLRLVQEQVQRVKLAVARVQSDLTA